MQTHTTSRAVNLADAAGALDEIFSPRIVGRVNDHYVKVARAHGDFVWHAHEHEDEMFLVLRGTLLIEIDGQEQVTLNAGDMFVVPKGVRHRPLAREECWLALFEPVATTHTGDTVAPITRSIDEQKRGWVEPG
ncbi:MAG TPA: cupin domain-containing protein [Longimicrobiales bacterium]|nr:cupin domain-containing protein [Longimicrobiales bacterium]